MNKVPIVFACDENYAMPFSITVESLLLSKNDDSFYDIYCLIPKDFKKEIRTRIDSLYERYKEFRITYINLENAFNEVILKSEHISFVTFYRFKIPELLPDYNKALYLDVDMIIKDDLQELLGVELDDFYVGAVKHPSLLDRTHIQGHKVPENSYFNAGMLLFNLKKIRHDKLDNKMISMIPWDLPIHDQDILNVACGSKVKHLDLKYNMMTRLCYLSEKKRAYKIYGVDYINAATKPVIIHYANKEKPWHYSNLHYNRDWDDIFLRSGFSDLIDLKSRKKLNYFKINAAIYQKRFKAFLLKFRLISFINSKLKGKLTEG